MSNITFSFQQSGVAKNTPSPSYQVYTHVSTCEQNLCQTEMKHSYECTVDFDRREVWINPKLEKIWIQHVYEQRLNETIRGCREEFLYANLNCFKHKRSLQYIRDHSRSRIQGAMEQVAMILDSFFRTNGVTQEALDAHVKTVAHTLNNVIETVYLSILDLKRCYTLQDYLCCAWRTYKMLTHGNVEDMGNDFTKVKEFILSMAEDLFDSVDFDFSSSSNVQGLEDFLLTAKESVESFREGYDLYKKIRHGSLLKSSTRVLRYCLTFGLFKQFGLTFENLQYTEAEKLYTLSKYNSKLDFLEAVLDGTVFVLERGIQAAHLKSWSPFLHNSSEYGKWVDSAFLAKEHNQMLLTNSNPEITYQSLLAEIDHVLDQGISIEKYGNLEKSEKTAVKRMISEIRIMKCLHTSAKQNQQMRKVPFSMLVYGDSSVAKTTFAHTVLTHFGRVRGLPNGPEFWYHRNPADPFYSEFSTQMWGMVLDDAGAMHPNKMNGIDPVIGEVISISNPNPTMAPMAELEQKGRVPIKTECLVVTSNIKELHANTYYAYPLALLRRMPWVITVSPRVDPSKGIDYRKNESPSMLDSDKIPAVTSSYYPDLWTIRVEKVIAVKLDGAERTQAKHVLVHTYTSIYDFLGWLTEAIQEHEAMNAKMKASVRSFEDDVTWRTTFCSHFLPTDKCPQCSTLTVGSIRVPIIQGSSSISSSSSDDSGYFSADEELEGFIVGEEYNAHFKCEEEDQFTGQSFAEASAQMYEDASGIFLHGAIAVLNAVRSGVMKIGEIVCEKTKAWVLCRLKDAFKSMLTSVGTRTWKAISDSSPLSIVAMALPVIIGVIGLGAWLRSDTGKDPNLQGGDSTGVGVPFPKKQDDERPNPWYDSQYEVCSFDVPTLSSSWKGKTHGELVNLLKPNIITLNMETFVGDVCKQRFEGIKALGLGGHLYVSDSHLFPEVDSYRVRIIHGTDGNGISINKSCTISSKLLFRVPEKELVFFELNLPARQDIRNLIPASDYRGKVEGCLIQRDTRGYVSTRQVRCVNKVKVHYPQLGGRILDIWEGIVLEPTVNGDCGSVLLADTPVGPMILGLHLAAHDKHIESISLTREDVEVAVAHFETPVISCNTVRVSSDNPLLPLHHKSTFRFLEEGNARVFGSFQKRASPRTSVKPSLLAPVLEKKGFVQQHGAPNMKGWQPWRKAILPSVSHKGLVRPDILREAADGYLNDMITKISPQALEELVVLNDEAALNGVPGVRYLEKMNRNSSAGYPFCKSKKFFLLDVEDHDGYTDCKDFTPEVWAEVNAYLEAYKNARVSHPIFVGQLKDEALPYRKIIMGKTRVFLIAPAAWTLVVRKYLLTFVRVFQKHRFVTEGMPGLPAQSSAWGDVYHYLTKFGSERMIAGDFREYDKVLESTVSLECWRVIRSFLKHAGWSEDDLTIIQAIGEDVAFPMCVMDGDLVEFDGTNPSGQPLTVILNCIANSIYMRYCYYLLNPKHECKTFQENVALVTYGDDNAAGVSIRAPWFTHTNIQSELLKIGIEYTMADKSDGSIPYIDISQVDFLKRKWIYDEDLPGWLAPLCEDSIQKMLMIGVASKTVSPEYQAIACVGTAVFEYFFYGRERFERESKFLKEVVEEAGLQDHVQPHTFPTYEDLKARWLEASAYEEHLKTLED
jgi:hypothetical protein